MATIRVKRKRRRRRRKCKLHYLRRRLEETQDLAKRRQLIAKVRRISPRAPVPEV